MVKLMAKNEIEKKLNLFEKRIEKLEKAVFNTKTKPSQNNYKGLSGGVHFLIDNGFFNNLKSKSEVHLKLKEEGYYHRPQAVDTTLRRDFVSKKKILLRTLENNIWKYALRK